MDKVDISKSMNRMVRLRNTLFRMGILIPVRYPGGDFQYILDEIEFVEKMEIKRDKVT